MKVKLKQIEGLAMAARGSSNHWVAMDVSADVGGTDAGVPPMELLLMGVAGCAAMDVLSILQKKKVDVTGFEVEAQAERAPEHPKTFTRIDLNFIITGGNIKTADVERAIQLTDQKYCPGTAMMKEVAIVNYNYQIRM